MSNLLKPEQPWCPTCHQLNNKSVTSELWSIYHRIRDGRSTYEPLVFTQDYLEEQGYYSEDPDDPYSVHSSMMAAMEHDMHNRGLCVTCGRPDLSRVNEDDVMTPSEAQDAYEYWAECEAERRMGC